MSFILALLASASASALSAVPSLPPHPPAQAVPAPDAPPATKAEKKPRKRRAAKRQDKFDIMGPILSEIGGALADVVGGDPDGVFLYVEIGDGWDSPSAYREEGDIVRYFDCGGEVLFDLLWKAWRVEPEGRRWSVMEYDIKGREFAVTFKYPDEVDVEIMDETRLDAALRARFGDKKIVYPPMPEGAFEWKP